MENGTIFRKGIYNFRLKNIRYKIYMYNCEDCGKNFTRKYSLKQHKDNKQKSCIDVEYRTEKFGEKIYYMCLFCDRKYMSRKATKRHMKNNHEIELKEMFDILGQNINIGNNNKIDNSFNTTNNITNNINIVLEKKVNTFDDPSFCHIAVNQLHTFLSNVIEN